MQYRAIKPGSVHVGVESQDLFLHMLLQHTVPRLAGHGA